ncbi:MAG: HD domain-containing phosphohydrolase [Thermodesulfobacteriota bacterium]
MSSSTLSLTIRTIDNRVLLPVGEKLSQETLEAIISSNKESNYQNLRLMQFDTVSDDLKEYLNTPPYDTIFCVEELTYNLLNDLETVHLPEPVLQSLNHFKEHDEYSYRHFLVVFALSTLLAKDLLPDYNERIDLAGTGPVHDIGKFCVPLEVLQKTTPLTKSERVMLEDHTSAGYVLLSYYLQNIDTLATTVARDHHERRDGSGYPRGIRLQDQMIEIIVVCDIYDALSSPRPYRKTCYDNRSALEVLSSMAESDTLSWDVVKALVSHNRGNKPHFTETSISSEKRGTAPEENYYGVIVDDIDD